jgi:hypothetical protein
VRTGFPATFDLYAGQKPSFESRHDEDAMPDSRKSTLTQISRRSLLGTAAALATTPALAEGCPIGPPAHEKGPKVWMDMDQVELDTAYDQSVYAPLINQILKRPPPAARRRARAWVLRSGSPTGRPRPRPSTFIRPRPPMLRFLFSSTAAGGFAAMRVRRAMLPISSSMRA